MNALPTISRFFHSIGLLFCARTRGVSSRMRVQQKSSSRPLWKKSSWFSTPLVTNDATSSQYDVTIRYDAFSSLPGGHSDISSSKVVARNEAANQRRASRSLGSRRIS
jgi:hypothetical protein